MFLAAFGKHPGWDDHIEDIGIETEHLASIKQLLYVQGIGGAIDAGAWDKLTAPQRVAGFEHTLICRTAGDLIAARLWSSTDGKGRSRYPMVVCVQCGNLPLEWVLREALPRLEQIEQRCKAATTADEVIAVTDAARQELRDLAAAAEGDNADFVADPADLAALADRPEMLDRREGMLRILYQLEREASDYARGEFLTASRDGSLRPVQVRVPACGDNPAEVVPPWMSFLMLRLDPSAEVWAIFRDGRPWLDLILGEPTPNQFFCFQASREALPLASEIPYTLDDDFRQRANQLIDEARAGRTEQVVVRPAAAAPKRIRRAPAEQRVVSPGRARTLRIILIAAGIVVLTAALIAAVIALAPPASPPPSERQEGDSGMTPAQADAWRDLCLESYNWLSAFLTDANESRLTAWRSDEHLAGTVVPVLTKSYAGELVLDPRQIAAVTGRHLKNLASSPPPGAMSADGIEKTAEAAEALATLRRALTAEAWPALARLKSLEAQFRKRGWSAQADYIRSVVARAETITTPDFSDAAPDLPSRIDEVLAAAQKADEVEGLWQRAQRQAEALKASGNPVLARFGEYAAGRARTPDAPPTSRSLRRTAGRLMDVLSVGEPIVDFLRDNWPGKLDLPTVAKDPLLSGPVSSEDLASGEIFPRWLASIRSEQFARLDPAADPRARDDWAERQAKAVESLAVKIDDLRSKYSAPEAGTLRARLSVIEAERKELLAMRWDREHKVRVAEGATALATKVTQLSRQVGTALAQAAGGREAYIANIPEAITGSDAINKFWMGRIKVLVKLEDMARLTTKVEKLEEDLIAISRLLPHGLAKAPADKEWNRVLVEEAAQARREQAMAQLLASLEWKNDALVRGAAFEAQLKRQSDELEAWRSRTGEAMAAFNAIDDALRMGAGLDECPAAAKGKSIEELVAGYEAGPVWKDKAVTAALAPVVSRVERLRRITGMNDPNALVAEAAAMATDRFEAARAAWKRLGRLPGWPATPDQFNAERTIHRDLSNVYARISESNAAWGNRLTDELVAGTRERWHTYFLALADPTRIAVAVARMDQYFLDANTAAELSAACAFRLALRELRGELLDEAAPANEAAFRRRVRQFVASARRIDGLADQPAAIELLESLSAEAAAKDEGADLTKAGPALVRWTPSAGKDGRTVTFTPPADAAGLSPIRFVRVEPEGMPAGYLCTTEASVGLFLHAVVAGDRWAEVRKLMRAFDSPQADMRLGPRTWTVAASGRPALSTSWVRLPLGFAAKDFYAAGAKAGAPSADSPVQYVSPAASVYFARLLGCRLPTAAEWSAARASMKTAEVANLRDATWSKQKAHIQKQEEEGKLSVPEDYYPDTGAFWPKGAERLTGADAKSGAADDGVLWFAPVGKADDGFRHLVGNVAELTFEKPDALATWHGGADELSKLLAGVSGAFRVIGGSAMSSPSIAVDKPQPLNYPEAPVGFADVGARLAFTAPAESVQVRVRRVLTTAGYPKAVGGNQ